MGEGGREERGRTDNLHEKIETRNRETTLRTKGSLPVLLPVGKKKLAGHLPTSLLSKVRARNTDESRVEMILCGTHI